MISPNKIIGSLVYRTRKALNGNEAFRKALAEYVYSANCLVDGNFLFWHYPGTQNEISRVLLQLGTHVNGARLKFPAILNFQSIRQEKKDGKCTMYYNLAIAGSVLSEWTTEEREVQVFDRLLRPLYSEFIRQIKESGYFQLDYGVPPHTCYEVFTTGSNASELKNQYGDYIDAIELHNLALVPKPGLCGKILNSIEEENWLVTADINELLNI